MSVVVTETQRIGNSHLRKVSVSESNVLLDEEVLTDPKIQALLLTVLVSPQTGSDQFRLVQTGSGQYRLVQTSSNQFRPVHIRRMMT